MASEEIDNEEILGLGILKTADLTDKLPKGYLSVSQVTQYAKCGMAYYYRYVLEVPTIPNSYTAQGSALHKGAEKMHLAMIASGEVPPLDYVRSVYEWAHAEYFDPNRGVMIMEDDENVGKIKDLGIKMTDVYYAGASGAGIDPDTKQPYRKLYPTAAEEVVRTTVTTDEGLVVPFLSVIDIVENGAVRDLKTKKKLGPQSEADNSLQLTLYAAFKDKNIVSIDQLVKPTKTMGPRYIRKEATRTPEEIAHAKEIVGDTATDIAAGRFRRTMPDNWWCTVDWCPYWDRCRGKKV